MEKFGGNFNLIFAAGLIIFMLLILVVASAIDLYKSKKRTEKILKYYEDRMNDFKKKKKNS